VFRFQRNEERERACSKSFAMIVNHLSGRWLSGAAPIPSDPRPKAAPKASAKNSRLAAEPANAPTLKLRLARPANLRRPRGRTTQLSLITTKHAKKKGRSSQPLEGSGRIQVRPLSRNTAARAPIRGARLRRYFPAPGFAIFFFFFFIVMVCFLLV
jgi:hypothetical protein